MVFKNRLSLSTFVITFLISASTSHAKNLDQKHLILSETTLNCVLENIDQYMQLDKDPVLLFFDRCPDLQPDRLGSPFGAPVSLPNVKILKKRPLTSTKIASLRKSELNCLIEKVNSGDLKAITLENSDEKHVSISLSECSGNK